MGQGDFAGALLWTAAAIKADPADPLLRWRAGNLIRDLPLLRLCLAHKDGVNTVSFSPDGRSIVTASQDHTARVWDAATGEPLTPPMEHSAAVYGAVFSPDGRSVLTAGQDGTARLWSATTGRSLAPPLRHAAAVWQAAFSSDGKKIITASEDHTARIWDAATGRELTPPLEH